MTATEALRWCSCGHTVPKHDEGGQCRDQSLSGWPCDCQTLDVDDEGEA
jgi:hypothetical protein